jgi:hypothetical protein
MYDQKIYDFAAILARIASTLTSFRVVKARPSVPVGSAS